MKANVQLLFADTSFPLHELRISNRQNGQDICSGKTTSISFGAYHTSFFKALLTLFLERCAQCHQQRREVRKATSPDPTILEGHCQVPQRYAEAWYVGNNFISISIRHDN
jgi:hypothetical protein